MSFSIKKTGLLAMVDSRPESTPVINTESLLFDIDTKLELITKKPEKSGGRPLIEPDRSGGFSMKTTQNSIEDHM